MTVVVGWLLNASEATPGQTRANTRQVPASSVTPADALSSKSGVVPGGTPMLLTGSGMSGSVSTGRAYVQGTSAQGVYPAAITVAEPITVANGHASLNRIDSVFLVVFDKQFDTSATTVGQVVYVQGTAAASPTAPPAPATSLAALRLWDILVPAGASAGSPINWGTALTDQRVYTVAAGGIGVGVNGNGAYVGQYRDTGSAIQRWNGSTWEDKLYLGTSGRLVIGTDAEWYRGAANQLRTPDSVVIDGNLTVTGASPGLWAVKSADTSRASTTTVSNDPHLTLSIPGSGTYQVQSQLFLGAGSSAGNLLMNYLHPAGRFSFSGLGPGSLSVGATVGQGEYVARMGSTGVTAQVAYSGSSAQPVGILINGLLTATGAGTLVLQWAQFTSSGTATALLQDSWMRAVRVA